MYIIVTLSCSTYIFHFNPIQPPLLHLMKDQQLETSNFPAERAQFRNEKLLPTETDKLQLMRFASLQERALNAEQPRVLEDTRQTTMVMLLRLCEPEPESKPAQNLSPMHGSWHRLRNRESRQHARCGAHYKLSTVALLIRYLGKASLYRHVNSTSMFDS